MCDVIGMIMEVANVFKFMETVHNHSIIYDMFGQTSRRLQTGNY